MYSYMQNRCILPVLSLPTLTCMIIQGPEAEAESSNCKNNVCCGNDVGLGRKKEVFARTWK